MLLVPVISAGLRRVCGHADPAAEEFQYPVSFDIRDLVTLEDVIEECALGPNGYALSHKLFCWHHHYSICTIPA